jgi:hypothetical protein
MPYRGPNNQRIGNQQTDAIFRHAGQVATWRQYISASAGVPAAGFGDAPQYREQTVTALFGDVKSPEMPYAAGMIAAADIYAVMRERPARQDELLWRGVSYRVESDPAPARLAGTYTMILKRSQP